MNKKLFSTLLCAMLFSSLFVVNESKTTYASTDSTFTATQTNAVIGVADGIKDSAYAAAKPISISHVAWENENATPATATMYLLWDTSYLYVFAEVIDDTHYGYLEGSWLEWRDALEMIVDLKHDTSYTGGYGDGYRGDKMCEGYYKIASGVGMANIGSTIQGTHWMWDHDVNVDKKGSYASVLSEDRNSYTVEYKINLGVNASEFMVAGRDIGVGVKIYDKHADDKNGSVTVMEPKNDGQHEKPCNLSSVKLVDSSEFGTTKLSGDSITVDGELDAAWYNTGTTHLNKVRKTYLTNNTLSNPNPAIGIVKTMYTNNKFYLYAEVNDTTKDLNNLSTWAPFGGYNSYKYNTDFLEVTLDLKHSDPTNYDQTWGSSYNEGKNVAGHFELAAGAGNLTYSADGANGWVYDPTDERFTLSTYATNHSTMYSKVTENGYTFEMEIDLSEAGIGDLLVDQKIGLYVGYYDRYQTSDAVGNWGEQSVTSTLFAFENYEPQNGPGWIPEYTLVSTHEEIKTVESYMNLAYRYTVVTENDVTTYPTSEFRLQVGVDALIVDIAASYVNASWGIEVVSGEKTVKFNEVVKEDGNIKYVVIGLGDVLNNIERASAVFTARAYIEVDGVTYYSEAVKSYSVAQMVAEYKTQGKPVDGMYQVFEEANLYA